MNEFGDLLGTPYAPVSKIAPVKMILNIKMIFTFYCMSVKMLTKTFL
jgi:hypothetical protein